MSEEKFRNDAKTVLKFIQVYCDEKHKESEKESKTVELVYKEKNLNEKIYFKLCKNCENTFFYSYKKLQECPHEKKPRCRKCPNPCYERDKWKELARIMRFSGLRLGLIKIKKVFKISNFS